MVRIVSAALSRTLLSMADAIEVNAQAFMQFYKGGVDNPDRTVMEIRPKDSDIVGHTLFKPAYVRDTGALGVKVISVFPTNARKGLPTVPGTILVLNDTTGMLEGIVDGTYVTALRTAAGCGAATRLMAPPVASRLVVFGAGAQAATHVRAMAAVRTLTSVAIVAQRIADAEALIADSIAALELPAGQITWSAVLIDDASAVQRVVSAAQMICTCTNSSSPLFDGSWLAPGTHITAIGSYRPETTELDAATIARSAIILDSDAAEECGEITMNLKSGVITREGHLKGTLGGLLCGDVNPATLRTATQDITLFKSVGVAFQDVATARAVLEKAEAAGAGVCIDM